MPSNDERREVAASLRELINQYGIHSAERFYDLLDNTLEDPSGYHSYVSIILYLADLIEPEQRTCRMEFSERKRGVYCSHCGERMDIYTCDQYGDGTIGYSYPFCYKCGAKVVD